ncbi:MAG: VCBS repeat-containing protein, partial [Abditibacteriales bacterium]|nr:VCBS repeat-containing protein [Abditibacteriales bacterium]
MTPPCQPAPLTLPQRFSKMLAVVECLRDGTLLRVWGRLCVAIRIRNAAGRRAVKEMTLSKKICRLVGIGLCLNLFCGGCQVRSPAVSAKPQNGLPPDTPGWFTDVTKESGLAAFVHSDGSCGRKFFVEQMGAGGAFFDYDNDGWLDIYLCNGAPLPGYRGTQPLRNALFRNNRDGTFSDVTDQAGVGGFVNGKKAYSIGCAVGDYDNDGYLDLYVTNYGPDILYHNNGDGTFTDVTEQAGVGDPRLGSSATFFDYDRDGFLDLYVCNYVKWQLDKDLFCFQFKGHKSYCGPNLYKPEVNTLYHNNGDGTFTDVSEKAGIRRHFHNSLGVVVLDYNGDGWEDLFVADDQTPNMLWRNNTDGTFTEVALDVGAAYGEDGRSRAGMGV